MAAKKDRVKPLFEAISTGDLNKIRQEAKRQLQEIQEAQAELSRDAKLIKELVARYGGPTDNLAPNERSAKVREAVLALVEKGQKVITPQDVVGYLAEEENIAFDVKRPASLVGTILSNMDSFERLEKNKFRFLGNHRTEEEE